MPLSKDTFSGFMIECVYCRGAILAKGNGYCKGQAKAPVSRPGLPCFNDNLIRLHWLKTNRPHPSSQRYCGRSGDSYEPVRLSDGRVDACPHLHNHSLTVHNISSISSIWPYCEPPFSPLASLRAASGCKTDFVVSGLSRMIRRGFTGWQGRPGEFCN